MKTLYHLALIILSWLLLSPCIYHPTLRRNRTNNIQCIDSERDSLLQFKHGITNDTCGLLTSWESHTDCCQWGGVLCSNITGHVVSLSLEGNGNDIPDFPCLKGKVSPSLGDLKHLEHLNLSYNNFHGEIPHQLGNLSMLTTLDLDNAYTDIPVQRLSWISRLSLLRYLDLSNANLSLITNWIPIVNNLHSLRVLRMDGCELSNEIPLSISYVNSSATLHTIRLSNNYFNSSIFQWLFNLPRITTQLVHLDLSENAFQVPIPSEFENFHSLKYFSLSSNSFQGSVSKIISNLCNLEQLHLGQNNFTDELGISDSIPISFWNSLSPNLQYLNMSNNRFYGKLPSLPAISNAFAIDLSSNLFEGVVPSGFANTVYLYLNDNRFSNYSNILCPKTESILEKLDLSNNLFSGELPDCWMNFSGLVSLHLESNNFFGQIPKSLGTLLYLDFLHLHNNSFSGPFPIGLENSTSLTILNLGYNLFSGTIPLWIGNAAQSLGALILRENHFVGEIPESICQLNNLQILDLAINHLSGVIPDCIGNFTTMERTENTRLDFLTSYEILFLDDYDDFETGNETTIVPWKEEEEGFKETFRFVKYIDLSGNELRGEIPYGISILNGLESLNLSNNKLSGHIPFEIGNLTALELLDLSNNHLTGELPTSLADVTTLGTMNVSNNHLSGEIPISTQLQSFNASSYAGNEGLCGAPLPSCSKDQAPSNVPSGDNTSVRNKDDDSVFFLGLYISVVLGFIVGFWGVCGTLIIKTSWRYAYFQFLDNIKDKIM
ncbi:receptor-like protein EIX2 [Silene latifolia]|uniref:receptor-like protein EIX2 n=1 Tax=Silene latifolia TaxID=37657 RepID=UPI003D783D25